MDQRLWQILSQTHESISYADRKAVGLLTLQGVLIGLVIAPMKDFVGQTGDLTVVSLAFFIAGIICVMASIIFTFLSFTPRLINNVKISPIFFGSIATSFKTPAEYSKYLGENFNTEEAILESLATEVHTNSRIASIKFKWVSRSTRLTVLGLSAWVIFLILNLF